MKYSFIIIIFLFGSCITSLTSSEQFNMANNAIDSIVETNRQIQLFAQTVRPGSSIMPYIHMITKRYAFAKIYEIEVTRMQTGNEKTKTIERYNSEINIAPEDYCPHLDFDSTGKPDVRNFFK